MSINKVLLANVRKEELGDLITEAISLKGTATEYANEFFEGSSAKIEDMYEVINSERTVVGMFDAVRVANPEFCKDVERRIEAKILNPDPSKKVYTREELEQEYFGWMLGYAQTSFQTKEQSFKKLERKLLKTAVSNMQTNEDVLDLFDAMI